jgi:hypothetical protein
MPPEPKKKSVVPPVVPAPEIEEETEDAEESIEEEEAAPPPPKKKQGTFGRKLLGAVEQLSGDMKGLKADMEALANGGTARVVTPAVPPVPKVKEAGTAEEDGGYFPLFPWD